MSSPRSPVRGPARGHEDLVGDDRSAVPEGDGDLGRRARARDPGHAASRPGRRRRRPQGRRDHLAREGLGPAEQPVPALHDGDSRAPSAPKAWAISHATTPPPRTTSRSGTCSALVASRLVHGRASRRPGTAGRRRAADRQDERRAFARYVVPSTSTVRSAGQAAPEPRMRSMPAESSQVFAVAVVVVRDERALGARRPPAACSVARRSTPRTPLGGVRGVDRAQQRLGGDARPEAALAADEPPLDDRDLSARAARRGRRRSHRPARPRGR